MIDSGKEAIIHSHACGRTTFMNNGLRAGLAGIAAWKLGGGIITTILIFVLLFWLLGKF
jgi:hypothetical protein